MAEPDLDRIHGIPVLPEAVVQKAPICVRLADAIRMTGLSRSRLYLLMNQGELEVIKVGRNTLIVVASIEAFIERQRKPRRP